MNAEMEADDLTEIINIVIDSSSDNVNDHTNGAKTELPEPKNLVAGTKKKSAGSFEVINWDKPRFAKLCSALLDEEPWSAVPKLVAAM